MSKPPFFRQIMHVYGHFDRLNDHYNSKIDFQENQTGSPLTCELNGVAEKLNSNEIFRRYFLISTFYFFISKILTVNRIFLQCKELLEALNTLPSIAQSTNLFKAQVCSYNL